MGANISFSGNCQKVVTTAGVGLLAILKGSAVAAVAVAAAPYVAAVAVGAAAGGAISYGIDQYNKSKEKKVG